MSSPTQRTLKLLRASGYIAAVVERFNRFAGPNGIRQDLFGFIDIVAVHPDLPGVLGVQATSTGNMSARRRKIAEIENARIWIKARNRIQIIGWAKRGARGKRKLWTPTVEDVF